SCVSSSEPSSRPSRLETPLEPGAAASSSRTTNYVNKESPFSTQQGIKGAEFDRVLVVLDDDEGTHVQFSYDKYLGIKPLSDREEANRREGKETTVDRTRRLFYVCCTRALKDLVVVLFTADVAAARRQIAALGLFPPDAIHLEDEIRQAH
ncbi:superfamily I DNA/RNA helicase, partial [Bradyrhizobium sp. I1.8.5]